VRRDVADLPTRHKLRAGAELTKSLARTEEYVAAKREMNQARQQVSSASPIDTKREALLTNRATRFVLGYMSKWS